MKITPRQRFRSARRGVGRLMVRLASALLGAMILASSFLSAQEGEPREGVTFWLYDDDGNWKVPLPNWSVDDVTALLDRDRNQSETPPFTIMSLDIDGDVAASQARLEIEYKISLDPSPGRSGPIRVPLGMKEGVFRPEGGDGETNFAADGPGEVFLDVDSETGGYSALIYPGDSPAVSAPAGKTASEESPGGGNEASGGDSAESPEVEEKPDGPDAPSSSEPEPPSSAAVSIYTVRITLFFPVTQTAGSDERILMLTPPSAVRSRARIVVPLPDVEISASEGVIADSPSNLDEKSSELKVYGFNRGGAATTIRWRPAEKKNEAALPVTYRVEKGVINLNPTGDGIEYDVTLPIRLFGGSQGTPSRLLRVELPIGARPDMQNVHVSTVAGDLSEAVYREIPAGDSRPHPMIEVSIPGSVDSLVLHLAAFVPTGEENKWECTGFHLEGAQKETGEIVVRLPDDENILPGLLPGDGVRDIGRSDAAEGGEKIARFRFYKEPFSLKSDPIPRQTRLIAQPEYQVLVSGEEMRMKARVAYSAYGAPLRSVRLRNSEWIPVAFDDESGIDSNGIYVDPETGETVFPLKKQVEGDFTLAWESVWKSESEPGTVEFELPELSADWVAPPILTIVPDDNIELVPLPGRIKGLTPKSAAGDRSTIGLPLREQTPLFYQVQREGTAEGEKPFFASRLILHTGEVSVSSSLSVRLDRTPAELVQTLEYHIKYTPIQSLDFTVPQDIAPLTKQEIFLNGKPVASDLLASEKGEEGIDVSRRTIRLPAPGLIGDARLEFRAAIDLPAIDHDQTAILNIPLAVPAAAHPEMSSAEASAPLEYTLSISDESDNWKETNVSQKGGVRSFGFSSSSLPQWLPLRAALDPSANMTGGLTAEYIWAQTFWTADSYFERISFRVSGNQQVFTLKLPKDAKPQRMAVSVDGVSKKPDFAPETGMLRIPLPESVKTETALVSLWYRIERSEHALEFPDLMEQTMIRRCFLQLILPPDTLLRQIPRGWSSEEDEFGRRPKTSQLAAAIGMSFTGADEPPKTANVYLLSSFNPPKRVHIHLISRAAIVLIGSGLILLFGICYIYFPRLRYVEGIILSVTLSLSIFLFRPQVILFYLQFAAFGAILILVVLLLRAWVNRRKTPAPAPAVVPPRPAAAPIQEKSRSGSTASKPAPAPPAAPPPPTSESPSTVPPPAAPSPADADPQPAAPPQSDSESNPPVEEPKTEES